MKTFKWSALQDIAGLTLVAYSRNALFEFLWTFPHYKNFKFACCLGGFLSSNCPKFIKIFPLLLIPYASAAFLKYVLHRKN